MWPSKWISSKYPEFSFTGCFRYLNSWKLLNYFIHKKHSFLTVQMADRSDVQMPLSKLFPIPPCDRSQ